MTKREIEAWKTAMIEEGKISRSDIDKLCALEESYAKECDEIADDCAEEGYPSNGSNYELRCESAREYYDDAINAILDKYEEGREC